MQEIIYKGLKITQISENKISFGKYGDLKVGDAVLYGISKNLKRVKGLNYHDYYKKSRLWGYVDKLTLTDSGIQLKLKQHDSWYLHRTIRFERIRDLETIDKTYAKLKWFREIGRHRRFNKKMGKERIK